VSFLRGGDWGFGVVLKRSPKLAASVWRIEASGFSKELSESSVNGILKYYLIYIYMAFKYYLILMVIFLPGVSVAQQGGPMV